MSLNDRLRERPTGWLGSILLKNSVLERRGSAAGVPQQVGWRWRSRFPVLATGFFASLDRHIRQFWFNRAQPLRHSP